MDTGGAALTAIVLIVALFALIIYSLRIFSQGLQVLFEKQITSLVNSFSHNKYKTFVYGGLLSLFIQSVTSTSTMALSFSSSGLLSLQELFMVLSSSFLGSLPLSLTPLISQPLLGLSLIAFFTLPMLYSRKNGLQSLSKAFFAFGLLHLTISAFDHLAVFLMPLKMIFQEDVFLYSPKASFWILIIAACLLMYFVRSVIAFVLVCISLAEIKVLPTSLAMMLVIGASLGQTLPILKTAWGVGPLAKRGAIAQFLVFLFATVVAFIIFKPIYNIGFQWAQILTTTKLSSTSIIIVHMAFTLWTSLLFLCLSAPLKKLMIKLIPTPEKKIPQKLIYPGRTLHLSPALAIEQVNQEIKKMAATVETSLQLTIEAISEEDLKEHIERVTKYERITDNIQDEIYIYLNRVMEVPLTEKQGARIRNLTRIATELESLADRCRLVVESLKEIQMLGVKIDGSFKSEITKVCQQLLNCYESTFDVLTGQLAPEKTEYTKHVMKFDQMLFALRKSYLIWLRSEAGSNYEVEAGIKLSDILVAIKQMRSINENIYEAYSSQLN